MNLYSGRKQLLTKAFSPEGWDNDMLLTMCLLSLKNNALSTLA